MGIPESKTRLTITMSKELDAKVRHYASSMGVTRGQFITMTVGQSIMAMDKSFQIVEQCSREAFQQVSVVEAEPKRCRTDTCE